MEPIRRTGLALTGAAALLGFGYTARLVARRRTEQTDKQLRAELQAARAPASDAAAKASGPLGKEYLHFPVAAVVGLALHRCGLGARAAIPLLASTISELTNRLVTKTLHIRIVPPGHPEHATRKPSFPSGHALESTAVALTTAYVISREDILPPLAAFSGAGAIAGAATLGRLVLDRHWVSDVIGGTLLGIAVAAGCATAYENLPPADRAKACSRRDLLRRAPLTD